MVEPAPNLEFEDQEARERAFETARAELDAGHGVDNERVKVWLKELAAGRRTPPPCE